VPKGKKTNNLVLNRIFSINNGYVNKYYTLIYTCAILFTMKFMQVNTTVNHLTTAVTWWNTSSYFDTNVHLFILWSLQK